MLSSLLLYSYVYYYLKLISVNNFNIDCVAAQEAVQEATGLVPTLPLTKAPAEPTDDAHLPPTSTAPGVDGGGGAAGGVGDTNAMQNDVLKAVTQLLQQSQQVRLRRYCALYIVMSNTTVLLSLLLCLVKRQVQ